MNLPPPGQADLIIQANDVTKVYGSQTAIHDIDLDVPRGSIVGLIGPSGCGKTTLVRTLTGTERPTSGSVSVFGKNPSRFDVRDRMRIGYMPQRPVLFPSLSVWGNLTFVASMYGLPLRGRRRRINEVLDLVELREHRHKRLAECSGGMQRRASLASTLLHHPDLLFLDEPTAGIDPILRERFWGHFRTLREEGATLVVPTQYVGEAVSCDLVAVLSGGELVTVQPPDKLARSAFGGDPLEVQLVQSWLGTADLERLSDLPFVRSVRRSPNGVIVVVDDAQTASELIRKHFDEAQIPIGTIGAPDLTYDEIFVALMARHEELSDAPTAA